MVVAVRLSSLIVFELVIFFRNCEGHDHSCRLEGLVVRGAPK